MRYIIKSDDHSGHDLPAGTEVEPFPLPADAPVWKRGVKWYTQGVEGDEVAIHPADLHDLPVGYRWATEDETERPDAILVSRSVSADGTPYIHGEADVAVPIDQEG